MSSFSVNVLCYGPHVDLARRCLESIVRAIDCGFVAELRVALNVCCVETVEYVDDLARRLAGLVPVHVYRTGLNADKYPLMRRMVLDTGTLSAVKPSVSHVMWFDDDSYLTADDRSWWRLVATAADHADLLGAPYSTRSRPGQELGIAAQPWCRVPPRPGFRFRFAVGGWWVLRREICCRWDFPFRELRHNGGDSILGELISQRRYVFRPFRTGVAIDADEHGVESRAGRRGKETPWPWQDYPAVQPVYDQHDFECTPVSCGPGRSSC